MPAGRPDAIHGLRDDGFRPAGCGSRQQRAEGVGFEPTDTFASLVFKTSAFVHSATPPAV